MLSGFLSFWSRKLELSGLNIGLPSGPDVPAYKQAAWNGPDRGSPWMDT